MLKLEKMRTLELLLSIIKSFYVCIKVMDFKDAITLPLLIKYNTKCIGLRKGCIKFKCPISFGLLSIAMSDGTIVERSNQRSILRFGPNGVLILSGKMCCSGYTVINCDGCIICNGAFSSNSGLKISCAKEIILMEDIKCGWNNLIIDSDGHSITQNGNIINYPQKVQINSHVWIGANVSILKGVTVPANSVVAMGTILVNKNLKESNIIIADNKVVKHNIIWKN